MYPAKFDYYRANSVKEAINLLQQHDEAKLLAGGHSLLPTMKLRLAQPKVLVDIGRLTELKEITAHNNTIHIGALCTYANLMASPLLQTKCPLLVETVAQIGDLQVRNKGTIGGSLAHADPAADLPATIMALNAVIHLVGPNGTRKVKATDFFIDLFTTAIKDNELLTAIEVNCLEENSGTAYLKFAHPASGFAICGVAAIVRLNNKEMGEATEVSLCFSGTTATPYYATAIANALVGTNLADETIEQAVDHNLSITDPMHDIYTSGTYRVELAKVYAKRALKLARLRASS